MEGCYQARLYKMVLQARDSEDVSQGVTVRLRQFVAPLAALLREPEQRARVGEYVTGLLSRLKRKTGEPLVTARMIRFNSASTTSLSWIVSSMWAHCRMFVLFLGCGLFLLRDRGRQGGGREEAESGDYGYGEDGEDGEDARHGSDPSENPAE